MLIKRLAGSIRPAAEARKVRKGRLGPLVRKGLPETTVLPARPGPLVRKVRLVPRVLTV